MTVKLVKIIKNRVINNNKGSIIKFINKYDKNFKSFVKFIFQKLRKIRLKVGIFIKNIRA